jgi:gliding motility associated protien GldN
MKRVIVLLLAISFVAAGGYKIAAQDNMTEVYVKENIPNKKPVPYVYTRESDVVWSKVVWRMIDLREKQNQLLYYPSKPIGKRMSLIDLLLWGIDNEGLNAYSTDDPLNEFKVPLTKDQVDKAMGAGLDTIKVLDPNTGEMVSTPVEYGRKSEEVKQILIKEKWFFDKQYSTMQVRIVGICPIRVYYRLDDNDMPTDIIERKQTFWIYFPEARPLLANHEIYNKSNDSQSISFDDIFWQRRFSSYIYAESNVYDNRWINQYELGLENLYEAERIKEWLFNVEHDLWEY